MSTTASTKASDDLKHHIVHLSQVSQVSIDEIERIYAAEVRRLACEARIQTFVGVLALGRTRDLLHRAGHSPRHP